MPDRLRKPLNSIFFILFRRSYPCTTMHQARWLHPEPSKYLYRRLILIRQRRLQAYKCHGATGSPDDSASVSSCRRWLHQGFVLQGTILLAMVIVLRLPTLDALQGSVGSAKTYDGSKTSMSALLDSLTLCLILLTLLVGTFLTSASFPQY